MRTNEQGLSAEKLAEFKAWGSSLVDGAPGVEGSKRAAVGYAMLALVQELERIRAVEPLTGRAIGFDFPEVVGGQIHALREWAAREGPRAERALFAAFLPAIQQLDERGREQAETWKIGGFNPTAIEDTDLAAARRTLIALRDALLLPSLFHAEYVVLFTHAVKALHEILEVCLVKGLETDGVGEETG